MEKITLHDGTVREGLILSQHEQGVEFAQIVRPPGQPMYLIIRPISAADVSHTTRLSADDRANLKNRIRRFRNRARIMAGQLDQIKLKRTSIGNQARYVYDGRDLRVESSFDEGETRRCVLAIEQIYRAFRHYVPARSQSKRPVRFVLIDSMDQYRALLRKRKIDIRNPAVFLPKQNLVMIGSSYAAVHRQALRIDDDCDRQLRELEKQDSELTARLAELKQTLVSQTGLSDSAATSEISMRRTAWEKHYARMSDDLSQVKRRSAALLAASRKEIYRSTFHEAFHAYLENHVYPSATHNVPTWLNEGLAQVFESGQLDDAALRVDAARPDLLELLNQELGSHRTRLGELLSDDSSYVASVHASDNPFAPGFDDTNQRARIRYAVAWALAYDLMLRRELLGTKQLDRYVSKTSDPDAIARFEQLVEMPLGEYEATWRTSLLNPNVGASKKTGR